MKPYSLAIACVLCVVHLTAQAQTITGTWQWNGRNDSGMLLKTIRVDSKVRFQLEVARGAPSYDSGYVEGEFTLKGARGTFTSAGKPEGCEIAFSFQSKSVSVSQSAEKGGCGFGGGVHADGEMLLLSDRPPKLSQGDPRESKPYFDCEKAASKIERQICDDTLLSKLDSVLADNYSSMLASDFGGSKASLKAEQRAWISKRDVCKNRKCLIEAYRVRIDETCGEYGVVSGVHPACTPSDDVIPHATASLTKAVGVQLQSSYATARSNLFRSAWTADSTWGKSGVHKQLAFQQYPEVLCGEGYDAVCSGRFEKSGRAILLTIDRKTKKLQVISIDED
jgi:uncharacterized protein